MKYLLTHIRRFIFIFTVCLALIIFISVLSIYSSQRLQIIRLTQAYALISVVYLYVALLASPLYHAFPQFPGKAVYLKGRKALGVSAFLFSLLHASLAFFGQLGGFAGLGFLNTNYLLAVSLGFLNLTTLSIMTITSLNFFIRKLGKWWKVVHRFVYVVGFFTVVHALMLGTHFSTFSAAIPQFFFYALLFLLLLESYRLDKYIHSRIPFIPHYVSFALLCSGLFLFSSYFLLSLSQEQTLIGIHAQHLANRQQTEQGRYIVRLLKSEKVTPNREQDLQFQIIDTKTNKPLTSFDVILEKIVHLIIVDSSLSSFTHIHPELRGSVFTVKLKLPEEGLYYAYVDFQPTGIVEQQSSFNLTVGASESILPSRQPVDKNFTKSFGQYEASLNSNGKIRASKMTRGVQLLSFTIRDGNTKRSITDLEPYLGSFGHLVLINQKTYQYIHVHPKNTQSPKPGEKGGPQVEFLPMALGETTIEHGTYRAFAQFKHKGKVFLVDYTINVE